jgi:hypothetical protein
MKKQFKPYVLADITVSISDERFRALSLEDSEVAEMLREELLSLQQRIQNKFETMSLCFTMQMAKQ